MYLFSLASGDGAGETEMFPSLGQREHPPKTWGQGCPWHRDRMSWQDCPESGPPPGFHRGLELTSVSKTEQWGTSRVHASPRWLVQEGKERSSLWTSTPGGGCRRTRFPTSDESLGKSSQRSLVRIPRRILRQKLHSRMEGRRGSWGICGHQAQGP